MATISENLLILVSTPIYIFIIGFEILISHYKEMELYTWKDTISNVFLMLCNMGVDLASRFIYLVVLGWCFQHHFTIIAHPVAYWLVLLLAEDFLFYWLHRLEHEVRFFWAVHVTHHSSEKFNFTTGFRSSVLQPIYRFVFFIPLALFGFSPIDILLMFSITQIWGILVHTELVNKLGILEYIFVTPSHHRVHHASNPKYLDKNMGMFLIIWDKIFGTFQAELPAEAYQPIRFGLTENKDYPNRISIITHEWQQMAADIKKPLTLKQKLRYLFAPPGWSHDGSRHTSEQMREREKAGL